MIHATNHHGSVVAAMLSSQESVQRIIGSFRGIEGALGAVAAPGGLAWQRKLTRVELYAVANALTPFGTVCCHHDVVGGTDSVEFLHVDPFAMLNDACVGSSAFANFLRGLVHDAATDEAFFQGMGAFFLPRHSALSYRGTPPAHRMQPTNQLPSRTPCNAGAGCLF